MSADDSQPTGSITGIYQNFRLGDPAAYTQLWNHFRHRLLGLAQKALAGKTQQVADAEDALQSAFISFWQRAERGDFGEEMDRQDLWNLLGVITVRKVLKHQRARRAQKRGGRISSAEYPVDSLAGRDSQTEFAITCEELLEKLEPELRVFAVLRLMGAKNREIAAQLDCTERKVERKLNLIRATWDDEVTRWTE